MAAKRVYLSKRLQRLQLQAEETPVEAPQESDEAFESQESETDQEDE